MKIAVSIGIGLIVGLSATAGWAAGHKPHKNPAAAKEPPVCAAITFRALPAGQQDGEQTAGLYKSRFARIELHATVKGGAPVTYFPVANGKRLAGISGAMPEAALRCAGTRKLPKPGNAAAACTGERFRLLVAHAGNERLALLYGLQGAAWTFCEAGRF